MFANTAAALKQRNEQGIGGKRNAAEGTDLRARIVEKLVTLASGGGSGTRRPPAIAAKCRGLGIVKKEKCFEVMGPRYKEPRRRLQQECSKAGFFR